MGVTHGLITGQAYMWERYGDEIRWTIPRTDEPIADRYWPSE